MPWELVDVLEGKRSLLSEAMKTKSRSVYELENDKILTWIFQDVKEKEKEKRRTVTIQTKHKHDWSSSDYGEMGDITEAHVTFMFTNHHKLTYDYRFIAPRKKHKGGKSSNWTWTANSSWDTKDELDPSCLRKPITMGDQLAFLISPENNYFEGKENVTRAFCVDAKKVGKTKQELQAPSKQRLVWRGRWSKSTFRKLVRVELPENLECLKLLLSKHYRFTLRDSGNFSFYWPHYVK
jgi:hypothetical protein